YTGRGSEEIASEAISAGVTDYLQKETGTDQYEVLAKRVENAIDQHRAEVELRRTREKIEALHRTATEAATCTDPTEVCRLAVSAAEDVGTRFPDEARRIHQGEAEDRPIFGRASGEEARALREEGIEVHALPDVPDHDA
ncbi:MAG: DUF1178 family protein, partial [Alphaproteobacteria bacterium]